jgi:hypothetical protein
MNTSNLRNMRSQTAASNAARAVSNRRAAYGGVCLGPVCPGPVKLLVAILALNAAVLAQTPTLNAVSPPTSSTQPNYTDFNNYVIPTPTVNGVTVSVPWSAIDLSTTSTQDYDFTDWDNANLANFANTNKVVNLIIMPATEGGVNTYTPSYVFTQHWANADGTYVWESSTPGWSPRTKYLPTTYILVSGHYQQEVNTVTPTTGFDGHCVSGTSSPTFSTSGGLSTEDPPGTDPTQCQWKDMGASAPLQAVSNCSGYEGAPAWQASVNFANGKVIAPDSTQFNFHYYQQSSGGTCTTGSSAPSTWNTSGGNTTDNTCTWHDNGTTIPNNQGLPVSYNRPFLTAYEDFAAAAYEHYSNQNPLQPLMNGLKIGYIRFGMTQGGEASPLCNTSGSQSSGWPLYSKYTYLAYISDMTIYFGDQGTTIVPQLADMHAVGNPPDYDYPDQEALYAFDNSIGISTNGLDVNDVLNVTGDSGYTQLCSTTPKGCTNGDWYNNFKVVTVGTGSGYCGQKMSNGKYPICSLQTLTASTPTENTVGYTGSLSVDGTFPGLIPTAQANGTTNLEIYPIDTLLAVSPNYCSDTGASCTPPNNYSVFQADYESAFETFLSETPGIYTPAFNSTLPSDTSDTFYWYPEPTATAYKLVISSGAGGGGTVYYTNSSISQWAPSVTASMSPTLPHGGTVYVHLSYELSGVWTVISSGHYTAP